jgi:hypothetical protein
VVGLESVAGGRQNERQAEQQVGRDPGERRQHLAIAAAADRQEEENRQPDGCIYGEPGGPQEAPVVVSKGHRWTSAA